MPRKLIGLTGPSLFTTDCVEMLEEFFDADFVMLYHNKPDLLNDWLSRCDGVVLAGGVDIHPTTYGANVWSGCNLSKFDLNRDIRELQIIDKCRESGKPMLGICRGHQLIAVTFGFGILPDLTMSPVCHQPQAHRITLEKNEPAHSVNLKTLNSTPEMFFEFFGKKAFNERRWINKVMGSLRNLLWVNSFHHQGVLCPSRGRDIPVGAENIRIFGTAKVELNRDQKDIIELMAGDNWVSCQWHPEYDWKINTASRQVLEKFKNLLGKK